MLIISLGICGVLAVRAHMRRKKLLKKILQLQFNKTIAEVGLALIAPIQGWKISLRNSFNSFISDSAEMSRIMSPNTEDCPIVKYNDDDLEVALLNYT